MSQYRLTPAQNEMLIELYRQTQCTADELPYTDEFENLYTAFIARSGLTVTRHDVWLMLVGLRKARRLVRKRR